MSAARIERMKLAWNRFFHEPISARPLSLFRMTFGALTVVYLAWLAPGLERWFGPEGISQVDRQLGYFTLLPHSEFALWLVFCLIGAGGIAQAAGFLPRFSSLVMFLGLLSIHGLDATALFGTDNVIRIVSFHLIFA